MPLPGGLPKRLAEAVEAYVSWRGRDRPVSMKRLVMTTRFMMPELGLSEKELSDLIAAKLVALGCDIDFNMNAPDQSASSDKGKRSRDSRPQAPIDHGTSRSAR